MFEMKAQKVALEFTYLFQLLYLELNFSWLMSAYLLSLIYFFPFMNGLPLYYC